MQMDDPLNSESWERQCARAGVVSAMVVPLVVGSSKLYQGCMVSIASCACARCSACSFRRSSRSSVGWGDWTLGEGKTVDKRSPSASLVPARTTVLRNPHHLQGERAGMVSMVSAPHQTIVHPTMYIHTHMYVHCRTDDLRRTAAIRTCRSADPFSCGVLIAVACVYRTVARVSRSSDGL